MMFYSLVSCLLVSVNVEECIVYLLYVHWFFSTDQIADLKRQNDALREQVKRKLLDAPKVICHF